MKKLAAKLWAVLMLMLVSMQTMATDAFTSNRTDFRDESIREFNKQVQNYEMFL